MVSPGQAVANNALGGGAAMGLPFVQLGTPYSPLAPGVYHIVVYGVSPSTTGAWTLKITS
jgi:hypothetical protein